MGVIACDVHNISGGIQVCRHIEEYVYSKIENKKLNADISADSLDYVTITKNIFHPNTPARKLAYCSKCAKNYSFPKLHFLTNFDEAPTICTACFYWIIFDIDLKPYEGIPFMNSTQEVTRQRKITFQEIREKEENFQVATYAKMDIAVERGRGSWIWTNEGERYLDLYGGHAVCATGHAHPHVVEALKNQAEKVLFYSNLVYSEIRAKAAEKLVSIAPKSLTKAFFCNSGTEANENAMRMARFATGREKIITFTGGFHGRTADSISATFLGKYREIGKPNVPGHISAEFGDLESVRAVADESVAAIMLEPIQSMAGVTEAPPEFFRGLREICDEQAIVLIFDEVQTGVGRTGNWFFGGSELAGYVEPDIITLAKSLGSGVPVGACLVNEKISSVIKTNDLGTTFGGGMLAMAAVLATLEAIKTDKMRENIAEVENYLRERLKEIEEVVAVRGRGGLLGIEFADGCKAIHQKLLDNKIITGTSSDPKVLRLLPPLCVKKEEIDLLVEILGKN
jgi:acetylornithine/succinyldiaminopimelate/putrescine aminotransferase